MRGRASGFDPLFRVVGRPARGVPSYADEAWPCLLYRPDGSFVMLDYELSVRPAFAEVCADLPAGLGHVCCFAWRKHPYERGPSVDRPRIVGWLGRTRDACHPVDEDGEEYVEDETLRLVREGAPATEGAVAVGAFTDVEGYRLPEGGLIRVQWAEVATPIHLELLVPEFVGLGQSWVELADWLLAYGDDYGYRERDNDRSARVVPLDACS